MIYEQPDVFPPADISEYHTEDSYEATVHYHQGDNRHVEYENQTYVTATPEQHAMVHKPSKYQEETTGATSHEVRDIQYSKQPESSGIMSDRFVSIENKPEEDTTTTTTTTTAATTASEITEGDQAPAFVEGERKQSSSSSRRSSRQARFSDGSFSPPVPQRRVRPSRSQRGGSPSRKKRSEWHDSCVVREENVPG